MTNTYSAGCHVLLDHGDMVVVVEMLARAGNGRHSIRIPRADFVELLRQWQGTNHALSLDPTTDGEVMLTRLRQIKEAAQ